MNIMTSIEQIDLNCTYKLLDVYADKVTLIKQVACQNKPILALNRQTYLEILAKYPQILV